jgi:hypothetical protein
MRLGRLALEYVVTIARAGDELVDVFAQPPAHRGAETPWQSHLLAELPVGLVAAWG